MKGSVTQVVIRAYAKLYERHRPLVLLLVIVVTIVSGYGLTRLTFNDDIAKMFLTRGETDADVGERTDRAVMIMLEADDLFTSEALQVLWNVSEGLKQIEGISAVASLYDLHSPKKIGRRRTFSRVLPPPDAEPDRIERARQQAIDHPMAREQLLSRDGKKTLILAEVSPELTQSRQLRELGTVVVQRLSSAVEGTGVKWTITGVPAIRIEMSKATVRDELTFNIVGPLVAMVIAFVIFRRPASVLIVVAGAAMGVFWTIGILGLIGEPINPINAVVAPLALTIGLTDSVHLLMHIRDDLAKGVSREHAVISAIPTVGFPSAMTSLTSAVGFVSLAIAELDVLARFGLCSALAVVVSFVSVMTVVPLLSSSPLGKYIRGPERLQQDPQQHRPTKWHTHLVRFIVDHRIAMLLVSLAATIGALYVGLGVQTDPRISNGLPSTGKTRRDFQRIEEEFGGALPLVAAVHWDAGADVTPESTYAAIAGAHDVLAGREITGPPLSLVNLYQSMPERDQNPRSLFQHLTKIPEEERRVMFDPELRRSVILARCRDAGGHPIEKLLTDVENEFTRLEAEHPGFRFEVVDTALHGIRNANMIVADLIKSMLLAIPLTLGVIMLELRSIRAGVIALLPNIFPMAALAATMVLFGQTITLTGAAVFVMCFGIAVDDTIHTITAVGRHLDAGQSNRDAIINAYRDLGDAVLSTSAILIGGLGVVMLGQSYFTRMFGVMFCIGLFWALIGDLIILPAVLACFPSRRSAAS